LLADIAAHQAIEAGVDSVQVIRLRDLHLGLRFRILDSFMVYGDGPGEVLLDREQVERVKKALALLDPGADGGSLPKLSPTDQGGVSEAVKGNCAVEERRA
jgi:hypothetical protein